MTHTPDQIRRAEVAQGAYYAASSAYCVCCGMAYDWLAAVKAVECLDACVGRIVEALDKVGGEALITADHGNVEQMEDESTGQAHTAHTCEPVPFIYVGKRALKVREGGVLADVAPTMLKLLGLPQPQEMTGKSILVDA